MARNLPVFKQIFKYMQKTIKNYGLGSIGYFERRYGSALYISGREGNKTYSYLTPYLDFDKRFANMEKLQLDMSSRRFEGDIHDLKNMWSFYKSVNEKKNSLEERSEEISNQIKKFNGRKDLSDEEKITLQQLHMQLKIIKQDIKNTKNVIWDLDETIIEKLLKLPNELDEKTPLGSPVVLKQFGTLNEIPEGSAKSHIEIGRKLGLLEYKNPMQCYLCNDAALFELGVLGLAGKVFSEDDMIRVAGSDFSRSSVVEGSGLNHENPLDVFILNDHCDIEKGSRNRMHLVGGASLVSFLAMHTKQLINPNYFPLRYFATGRQYTPFPEGSTPLGLFTLCQSSAVHAFIMVDNSNSTEYTDQFERLLKTVCKLYDKVCNHYRIVMRSAAELRSWETKRVSFELWSPFTKQYIEVGHISVCGTYLSKRLLIAYQTPNGRDFPAAISGTVLSVPRLLGCLLEQNTEKFVVPAEIAKHMPVDSVAV